MKKIVIWFVSATIIAVVIAAGFFYYPNKTQSSNHDAQPDVQAKGKEVIIEYPLKMGTANDKLVLRVTTTDINVGTIMSRLDKIDILNNNEIVYTEKFDRQTTQENIDYGFLDFRILKGNNQEYLAYGKVGLYTEDLEHYIVLNIQHNANKIIVTKLTGSINGWEDVLNPKLDNHLYQLIEDKYIISAFWDIYFYITAYYEITDNSVHLADKEFVIQNDSIHKKQPQPRQMKVSGSIIMYTTPDFKSTSSNIKLTETTQVEFIGIRYIKNNKAFVHVIIDGKDGWIDEEDLTPKFGIDPYWTS